MQVEHNGQQVGVDRPAGADRDFSPVSQTLTEVFAPLAHIFGRHSPDSMLPFVAHGSLMGVGSLTIRDRKATDFCARVVTPRVGYGAQP